MTGKKGSLFLLFLILGGAFLREKWLFSSLEYDEIWTMLCYTGKPVLEILTDLSTPNNHPLNTLGMKLTLFLGGTEPWALRLIPFLAGVLSIPLTAWIGKKLFSSRLAGWGAAGLMAVSQPLIFYSGTVRGYALQVFLLLLFSACLLQSEKRPLFLIGALISGILAMLDLTTSVLFLFPVSLIYELKLLRIKQWKQAGISAVVLGILGVFILGWCLGNLDKIQTGQGRFGMEIHTVSGFFRFLGSTLFSLGGFGVLAAALAGWLLAFKGRKRRMQRADLFLLLFPLAGALIFRGGPARVYLSLIPLLCLRGGFALARIPYRRKLFPFFLILFCGGIFLLEPARGWNRIDWTRSFAFLQSLPPGSGFAVLPTESLPLGWNNRERGAFFAEKVSNTAPGGMIFSLQGPGITALTADGSDMTLVSPAPVLKKEGLEYRAFPIGEFTGKEKVLLIRCLGIPRNAPGTVLKKIAGLSGIGRAGFLNYWTDTRMADPSEQVRFLILAEQTEQGVNLEELSALLEDLPGSFSVFSLTLPSVRADQK